jgi:hypothetical protein
MKREVCVDTETFEGNETGGRQTQQRKATWWQLPSICRHEAIAWDQYQCQDSRFPRPRASGRKETDGPGARAKEKKNDCLHPEIEIQLSKHTINLSNSEAVWISPLPMTHRAIANYFH